MNTEYIKELLRQQREICANVNWYYASLSVGKRNILNAPSPTIDEEKLVSGLTVEELEGLKQENEHLKFVVEQLEFEKQLSPKVDEEKLSGVRVSESYKKWFKTNLIALIGGELLIQERKGIKPDLQKIENWIENNYEWLSESPAEKEEDLESSSTASSTDIGDAVRSSSSNSIEQAVLQRAMQMMVDEPTWRYGQSLFNALYEINPEIANKIRGGRFDPFYSDELVQPFFSSIKMVISEQNDNWCDTSKEQIER
jgi:hypothetical protein